MTEREDLGIVQPDSNRHKSGPEKRIIFSGRERWMMIGGIATGASTILLLSIFGVPPNIANLAGLPAAFVGGLVTNHFIRS